MPAARGFDSRAARIHFFAVEMRLSFGLPIFPRARQSNKQAEASSGRFAATFPQGEGFKLQHIGK